MVVKVLDDYRDNRYTTIAMITKGGHDLTRARFVIMLPGYDILTKNNADLVTYHDDKSLRKYLSRIFSDIKGFDRVQRVDMIMGFIWNFGGININEESQNWKAFIKLKNIKYHGNLDTRSHR